MDISSAAYDPISPTDLDNFTNPLRLPGDDGVMGILDASDAGWPSPGPATRNCFPTI